MRSADSPLARGRLFQQVGETSVQREIQKGLVMKFSRVLFVVGFAALAAACATGHTGKKSLEDYCATGNNSRTDICKVNAASATRDSQIRQIAQSGVDAAARAQSTADAALARQDNVYCETRTFRRSDTGSCSAGYTLVGCAQTHYTYKSGGPTVIRELNDTSCRFATRVLEIQARCCMVGAAAAPQEPVVNTRPAKSAPQRTS